MSDNRPKRSRRKLLKYSGVAVAAALAGCNAPSTDSETDGNDNPPEDPAAEFELAGEGSVGFRPWLNPEYTLESPTEGEQSQLYQFIDYGLIPEGEMSQQVQRRENFADRIGVEPTNIQRELLLGPIEGNLPYKILFGSFDATALATTFENTGFERTSEPGDFVVFDGRFAISADAIIEHPNCVSLIEQHEAGQQPFEGYDAEMQLLLDLIPAGPQATISNRGDIDDIVLDGLTILEVAGPTATHGIRTLVFTDESAATLERAREIDIDSSVRNTVLSEEIHGRVAMIESRREE
ncbi:twin-arginine translocation signal domain-containing protein [Halovenus halobia]|uniref:twin-arginine translocation signal domain-containing protein n=1 Tax=Halovenus halobia TaxID=3396622 RepID=UPI003F57B4E1